MNSIDFLKEKLNSIHLRCPYLEIKYEYRDYINTHIIDVKPLEQFENDESYVLNQLSLEKEFENLFPEEEILFISESELISIEKPILELGMLLEECFYNIVIPPIKVNYSENSSIAYDIDVDNISLDFEIPEPPPIPWWKKTLKKKKDLEEYSGSFFL